MYEYEPENPKFAEIKKLIKGNNKGFVNLIEFTRGFNENSNILGHDYSSSFVYRSNNYERIRSGPVPWAPRV